MSDNILILGGTGFIGDYLVKNLVQTKFQVSVIYRTTKPTKKFKEVTYLNIDASKNIREFHKALKSATYLVILSRPDIKIIKNIQISGSRFKKIIYASTLLMYTNSKKAQKESAELVPGNDYEKDKIEEEKELVDFCIKEGIYLCIARLTNIYGDVKNRGLVHYVLDALVKEKEFTLNNAGVQIRDFLFVEDAAKYLELLIFIPQTSKVEIFNISSNHGYSAKELILTAEELMGKKLKITKGHKTNEKLCVIGNNKKVISKTSYKPQYTFRQGLTQAISNYQR